MRRREFIALIAGPLLAWPLVARAQAPTKQPRIALVHSGIPADELTETGGVPWIREFLQELRRLGYADGRNVILERYSAEGRLNRIAELARTVVGGNPDVIVTNGPLVNAFAAATTSIPIVAIMGDPTRGGVATSPALPSANITGVTVDAGIELYDKQLQVLKEALPAASKIAYLRSEEHTSELQSPAMISYAVFCLPSVIGMPLDEATRSQLQRTFAQLAQERFDAVMVSPSGGFLANRQLIVELAASKRLPSVYPYRDFVEGGGLMAYEPDLLELSRHLADQVRQVLGGAIPGDIPIYRATAFKLIVNLRAAQALGVTLPPALLARADEVIE